MTDKAEPENDKDPASPASGDAGAAGEPEPMGRPTSDRYGAEVAHHDEKSDAGMRHDHIPKE